MGTIKPWMLEPFAQDARTFRTAEEIKDMEKRISNATEQIEDGRLVDSTEALDWIPREYNGTPLDISEINLAKTSCPCDLHPAIARATPTYVLGIPAPKTNRKGSITFEKLLRQAATIEHGDLQVGDSDGMYTAKKGVHAWQRTQGRNPPLLIPVAIQIYYRDPENGRCSKLTEHVETELSSIKSPSSPLCHVV